jgi:hypothetical protein
MCRGGGKRNCGGGSINYEYNGEDEVRKRFTGKEERGNGNGMKTRKLRSITSQKPKKNK